MRTPVPLIVISLVFTALTLPAQKPPGSATSANNDYLPAGPFHFELGTVQPTYMDAFDDRPAVKSPDGKLEVTVTGPKKSYEAWVTISRSTFPDGPVQVWPIQRSVDVLWRPDSQAFALTDNRYSNLSYVFVCGTEFRMGESDPGLGVPIIDLTPVVKKAFEKPGQEYYAGQAYDPHHFYAKILRWIGNEQLLVGVSVITEGPPTFPNRGLKEWDFAYLVDVPKQKVIRDVGKDQLLSEYKIKVPD